MLVYSSGSVQRIVRGSHSSIHRYRLNMGKKAAKAVVAKVKPTKRSAPPAVKPAAPIRRRKRKKVADEDSDAELQTLLCEDLLYSIFKHVYIF
jgi:hypothetical protein